MTDEVHVGDVGTVFEVTVLDGAFTTPTALDISNATERKIFLRRPSDTVISRDAAETTDGTDGKMEITSISGDIDAEGRWSIQGKIVIPEGTFYTDIAHFVVEASLVPA